jgi:hypothetical protein
MRWKIHEKRRFYLYAAEFVTYLLIISMIMLIVKYVL